ncbi:zinc-binding alcohol dehydrogenase family protein [Botrimarina sp.]|uniref:zinc-binding alcohol dehydrogenase family protein n=1 Tax=Botrimarina sp. TaxID=2795802 RepID=UPI0032EB42CE
MKTFRIDGPGAASIAEAPRPTPGAGEVLLRVETVGLCGTDLNTFRGRNPLVTYPRVPGHEVGATIAELGPGVEGWSVGQAVLAFPYNECGRCPACRSGRFNCCRDNQTLGVQRDGAMAEYFVLPAAKLLTAEGLSHTELALVEPLTVGFHAVARGQVAAGDTVAVFGCGAIGLGVIAGAAERGARVIAIDLDDAKLALARKCGATDAINSGATDLHTELAALTDGDGPAVTIEAVGLPQTFRAAVEEVAFAGRVVYIGYAKAPVEYETKLFVMKELDIRGSRNALASDFADVIAMLQRKHFPVADVVTHTGPLADAPDLLRMWSDRPGEVTKIHVRL